MSEKPWAESPFCAIVSRMRYIERWALMRSSRPENLSEHTLDVAMIAHMLCVIGNVRYGRALDADRAAVIALYHDASEIITGDMPTPVKYKNDELRGAYKDVEREAEEELLATLPDDLRPTYEALFAPDGSEDDDYLFALVKAADKLSAYVKCIEERTAGNKEFLSAEVQTRRILEESGLPEVTYFLEHFIPAFEKNLDELGTIE